MKLPHALPILLLTACSLAPDAVVPTDKVPVQWRNAPTATAPADTTLRYSDFGSAQLQRLITTALANNTDIAAALAQVEQARASAIISGAGQYPQVDATATASNTRTRLSSGTLNTDRSEAALAVSYEADLWQRNRNLADAAQWRVQASAQDKAALAVLVSSEVARLYSGVLAFDARLGVAQNNLKTAQDVLRVTEARYTEGAISGLERAQQRTAVANTQAAITGLRNQRALFFNQLAQLVGTTPAQLTLETETLDALKINTVALGEPWQLLQRRPDIAAQEARLRAANIDIGVARANARPSLSLALNAGVASNPSTTLVGLAASFFAPIFHGGALEAEIDRSKAARDEQVATYQTVLLQAFREVEDALNTFDAASKRRDDYGQAAADARKAYSIARAQFDAGSIDYTTLLQTQAAQLQAEDNYYAAVQTLLAANIDLIRALGGAVAEGAA